MCLITSCRRKTSLRSKRFVGFSHVQNIFLLGKETTATQATEMQIHLQQMQPKPSLRSK